MRKLLIAIASLLALNCAVNAGELTGSIGGSGGGGGGGQVVTLACGGVDDTALFNSFGATYGASATPVQLSGPVGTNCALNPATLTNNVWSGAVSIGPISIKLVGSATLSVNQWLFQWSGTVTGISVQNATIDLNGATIPSGLGSVFYFGANVSNLAIKNNIIKNAGAGEWLLVQAYGVVTAEVSGNYFQLTAGTTAQNQALNLGTSSFIVNNWNIHDNQFINTGLEIVAADNLRICNNEIAGWAFGAGIGLGPNGSDTTMRKVVVCDNNIHDAGTSLDSNGFRTDGIDNWLYGAEIVGNRIYKTGGAGISNGGGNSQIVGNWVGDSSTYVGGPIDRFTLTSGGSGCTNGYNTGTALTGGTGTAASANFNISGNAVVQASLVARGDHFLVNDSLSATVASCSGITLTVNSVVGQPGIVANTNGTQSGSGSSYHGNHVYEDGGGNTGSGIGDTSSSTVSYIGENTVVGTVRNYYDMIGTVNYTTTPTIQNRLVNPCFQLDQTNEGAAVTANGSYVADQWKITASTGAVSYTAKQTASTAQPYCQQELKATVSTQTTPPAANFYEFAQPVELNDVIDLSYAGSLPQTIFVEFCAKASVGGTYSWVLQNVNANRTYGDQYNLPAAATEKCFSFRVPGDTSSLGVTATNQAMNLVFDSGTGATNQTSTIRSWIAGLSYALSSSTQLINAASTATLEITAVRVYAANAPTKWVPRAFKDELQRAQRFYAKSFVPGTAPVTNAGANTGETQFATSLSTTGTVKSQSVFFPVQMRVSPGTLTFFNPSAANANVRDETAAADGGAATAVNTNANGFQVTGTAAGTGAANDTYGVHWTASARY